MSAVSKLTADRQDLIDTCNRLKNELADTTLLDEQSSALLDESNLLTEMIKKLIEQNASTAMNQEEYARKYNDYAARFEKATAEYEKLQKQKLRRLHQSDILETFAFEIISLPDLRIEFSDRLWLNLIDRATVYGDEKIVFKFKNGAEVEEEL